MPWPSCHVAMDPMTWYCSIDTFGRLQVGRFFSGEKGWHAFFFSKDLQHFDFFFISVLKMVDWWFPCFVFFWKHNIINRWTWSRKFLNKLFSESDFDKHPGKATFFDNWKPFNGASLNHALFRSQHLWKPGTCGSHWQWWGERWSQQQPFLQGHWVFGVL